MQSGNKPYIDLLNKLSEKFKEQLIARLKADNRVATGALIESVEHTVTEIFFGVQSEILWLSYGNNFETGVPPENIPFGSFTGKKTSKYIEGLKNWVLIKGIAGLDKDALSIAFAIAKKQKEKGAPLDGKINVLTDTIKEFTPFLEKEMEQGIEEIIFAQIDSLVAEISQNFKFIDEV